MKLSIYKIDLDRSLLSLRREWHKLLFPSLRLIYISYTDKKSVERSSWLPSAPYPSNALACQRS